MKTPCYHCGETIPNGLNLSLKIEQTLQPMCCIGCQSVAQAIIDNGLGEYYRFRTAPAQKGEQLIPEQLQRNKLLDDEGLQSEFAYKTDDYNETILTVDGISCAACAWLIEMQLIKINGLIKINVNATTQRATIRWDNTQVQLSQLINHIANIGYQALPFKASTAEQLNKTQSNNYIKRLGISGILMMQVMMIAFGLYFGAFSGMDEYNLIYLRYASLFLTLPIVTYGALPFYKGAINALKAKRLSMDVPVAIAISLAFSASAWATITQQGEVYFESVSMFTFLLLIGKFLEFRARSRAAEVSANLLKLMPMTATKLIDENGIKKELLLPAKKLCPLDIVLIKPGEVVPADGTIISGNSQLNEAMLSGEQLPLNKSVGDTVFAGTINGDGNINVEVKQATEHSFLSQLIRLSESSQAHKPKLAKLSDKIAQYFVAVILLTAIGTAFYWQQHLPEEAFWITLSVLVATCPCALSLATPTALTCATTRLNREGIMIKSAHVMETLPKLTTIAFDKTGTLTSGDFSINEIKHFNNEKINYSKQQVLSIAAALESYSEHPLAKPFKAFRDYSYLTEAVEIKSGAGIQGKINGKIFQIGKPNWLLSESEMLPEFATASCLLLADNILVAAFYLSDEIRDDAKILLNDLKKSNIYTIMLSGDNPAGCEKVQASLNLNEVHSALTATNKMAVIKNQPKISTVAMVGDGVNDTPVFGAAHVSIAMGSGTDIAKSGADVILLNNRLKSITTLRRVANKTRRIIWQNYFWAFGYNAIVLPLAVSGFITPYMAVIGMSASSILVITNSLRLLKK
ncbi:heavy metal translocating P-type ATPase [Colwellia hornerae]|uniref:Cadmium-translocating P-type ATPase n=1 Tax=Colwellia hornerae TaxID=89402 RepID=A0A5C6Q928_9GAMM|nr:heavy metal translocating P-type ATPase [Colwellia hornerae]TWX57761.1 cadmium-translocating P-type ATPase [Colwellia hornerae]TWX62508.1 cadmium-translocating P-type ATPase [Colwellia hornerae]TWX65067.1 cadmium-translocating P-type ATPase [Colwellia hornerae]